MRIAYGCGRCPLNGPREGKDRMKPLLAAPVAMCLAAGLASLSAPVRAQDPEPPLENRYEADLTLGSMPFTPGQTFSFAVPSSVPQSTSQVLVVVTFTCSLISGQIQDGLQVTWTIWTPVIHSDQSAGKASFQDVMWCAPGQLTTSLALDWLPITAASRTVFTRLDTSGPIPWDKTQSAVKIVSYRD